MIIFLAIATKKGRSEIKEKKKKQCYGRAEIKTRRNLMKQKLEHKCNL